MWEELLIIIITGVIGAILTRFLVPVLNNAAKNFAAKLENTKHEKLGIILKAGAQVAENVVYALEESTVGALRATGLSPETVATIKAQALDLFKNNFPNQMIEVLKENKTNFEEWADSLIKEALKKMKLDYGIETAHSEDAPTDVEG
jgi:flagellar motor component MotA